MINLRNFYRQHNTIRDEVSLIENEVSNDNNRFNVVEIVLHINRLAGHLKIHFMEEDNYLYPELLQCEDKKINTMAQQYIDEMGDLAKAYRKYKNAYNISSKIKCNSEQFVIDTIKIMKVLKTRVEKEDNELYSIIQSRNL